MLHQKMSGLWISPSVPRTPASEATEATIVSEEGTLIGGMKEC